MAGNSTRKRASSSPSEQQQAKRRQCTSGAGGEHAKKTCSRQNHSAASNSVAMPMVVTNGIAAPLMLSPAVTTQVQLFCFVAVPMVAAASSPPASGGGVPLAAALCKFCNGTLERMLTELAEKACTPPQLARDRKRGAPPPPWWPTANEPWWGPEVEAHLRGRPTATPVPFASPRRPTKAEKVAVLVAVVKHVAPDFGRIAASASRSRLTELEAVVWERALRSESQRYVVMPSFILLPPPPPSQNVRSAESAAHTDPESEKDEQTVDFSVSGEDTAHDGGSEQTVTTEPELEQDDDDGNGTADPAFEGEGQKPEDTPVPLLEQHGGEDHDHHLLRGDLSGELAGVASPEEPALLLEQHCDEGHEFHQHDGISGELSGAAVPDETAPEDVDWFDCDEVRRGLAELEILSFFGGYYI